MDLGDNMDGLVFLESIKKMPLMELPVRSTYVGLPNAGILISPGSNLTAEQLRTLPRVTDILAPNLLHSAGIPRAASVFPEAKIWGVPGLKKLKPSIQWTHDLSPQTWPYQEELAVIPLMGMPKVREVVFFHKRTKSLIVTDLCFNLMAVRGLGARIILGLFGTYRQFGVSRFFAKFIEDKVAFEDSVDQILSYDFQNIIVGHGDNLTNHGREHLLKALQQRGLCSSAGFSP